MKILKTKENNVMTIKLEGWLDTQSASEFAGEIEGLEGVSSLILDFDKLEYISSSGLRVVVSAYKKMTSINGDFQVINVGSEVMDVFKLTGIDTKLNISGK